MNAPDAAPVLPGPVDEIAAEALRQRTQRTIDFDALSQPTVVELVRSAVERVRTGDAALRAMLIYVAGLCHNALASIDRKSGARATASSVPAGDTASGDHLVERARIELAPAAASPGSGSAGFDRRRPVPPGVRLPYARDDD